MKSNNKGFTLIELVMVIVILGILAAVAIPRFANLSDNAKESAFKGAVGAVKSGVVSYLGQTNAYPTESGFVAAADTIISSDDFNLVGTAPGGTEFGTAPTATAGTAFYIEKNDGSSDYTAIRYDEDTGTVYGPTF